jgi:hypothetical protein
MWRRVVALITSVVLFGVLSSCGSDAPADGSGGPGDNGGNSGSGFSWVPVGPKDPTSPTPTWPAYNYFANGKCSQLRTYLKSSDAGDFGRSDLATAMLAVCRAAVDGQTKQWAVAAEHADADPTALGHDCLAPLVKGAIDRALAWHKAHPGQKPKVKFQRVKGETKCGRADNEASRKATAEPTDEPTDGPTTEPTSEESSPGETTEPTG